jgi:hypothetical protein
VRPSFVAWPVMTRVGRTFPFADLAKAATRGWQTQLGTRISSRFES